METNPKSCARPADELKNQLAKCQAERLADCFKAGSVPADCLGKPGTCGVCEDAMECGLFRSALEQDR